MRPRDLSLALALALTPALAHAQDAAAQGDASAARPAPVDPATPLPPGHPGVAQPAGEGDPHGAGGGRAGPLHRADMPVAQVEEASDVPPGTVVVRVLDTRGQPVPEAAVHLGMMRNGESSGGRDLRAGPDGIARFERLQTGQDVAYRLSTEHEGARFSAPPFQLTPHAGARAQLVRYETSQEPRGVLLWDARFELRLRDERLTVVERIRIVNLSAMGLGDATPEPRAYAPRDGIRFALPRGYTAFQAAPMMADARLVTEGDFAVLRGAVAPTTETPLDVVFQYQLRLDGGDFAFESSLPLPVVSATVASEAPPGLTLSVDGMPPAQSREGNGDRVLVTGMERRPSDAPLQTVRIRLGGIPRAAGPMRTAAAAAAGALVLAALFIGFSRGRRGAAKRTAAEIDAERDRVLAEVEELARLKEAGEVGPKTYARRRRELALWLASLLKEREDVAQA